MLNRTIINTIAVFSGSVAMQFFGLVMGIILARYLGPEHYGEYSFAISVCYIFKVFTDFGMNDLFVRDIAADKQLTSKYLGVSLIAKTLFALISICILYLFMRLSGYSEKMITYALIFSFHIFFVAQLSTIDSIFQAHEKMENNAYLSIITGSLGLIFILLLVYNNESLTYIIVSRVLVFFISFLIGIYMVGKIISWPSINFGFDFLVSVVKKASMFLTIGLIHTLYLKVDIIMLSKIKGESYVGYYTPAANDLFFGLFIIPGTIATVVYPIFARHYRESFERMRESVNFSVKLLLLIGIPISVGTFILANKIILFIFGDQYQHSVVVLQVMAIAISFMFVREPLGFAIASIGKEHLLMWLNAFFLVMNIILNLFLIPFYAHVGAAATSVVCIIFSLFLAYYILSHQLKGGLILFSAACRPAVAALIMGVVVYLLRDSLHVILTICVGAIVYATTVMLLKPFSRDELQMLKSIAWTR